MKKIFLFIISALIIVSFSNCSFMDFYAKNNIIGTKDDFGSVRCYFDKVALTTYDSNILSLDDLLSVRLSNSSDYSCILYGDFDEAAYNNGELFILTDEQYYVFDIKNYSPEDYSNVEDVQKELRTYSKNEFKKKYPDYQKYLWFDD